MFPMLGWEVIEGQEYVTILGQFPHGFVVLGVSETLCMRLSPRGFDGSSVEPFWV
jgi:hypothetical protein